LPLGRAPSDTGGFSAEIGGGIHLGACAKSGFAALTRSAIHLTPGYRRPALDSFDDVVAVAGPKGPHCSGVVVSRDAVLTARHCLPATEVRFGTDAAQIGQATAVLRAIVHPDRSVDAALLVLERHAPAVPHLRRMALETEQPKGVVRMVGFGAVDSTGQFGFGSRRATEVPVAGWGCDLRRAALVQCDPQHDMVIRGGGGRDTCDGDSGGPVFEWLPFASPYCPWRLLAITSRPVARARMRCGSGGVYERVDRLEPWLGNAIKTRGQESGRRQSSRAKSN